MPDPQPASDARSGLLEEGESDEARQEVSYLRGGMRLLMACAVLVSAT